MELTEFEHKVLEAIGACRDYGDFYEEQFIEMLREIMLPKYTSTERMFLDEIRELYEWNDHLGFPHLQRKEITKYSNIYQRDFKKTNLQELING